MRRLFALRGLGFLLATGLFGAGVAGAAESSAPASYECVTSQGGELRSVSVAPQPPVSCLGDLFGEGEGLWAYAGASSREGVTRLPELEPGGALRVEISADSHSTHHLPGLFRAEVLRSDGASGDSSIVPILCRSEDADTGGPPATARTFHCPAPVDTRSLRVDLPPLGTAFAWDLAVERARSTNLALRLTSGVVLVGAAADEGIEARLLPRGVERKGTKAVFAGKDSTDLEGGGVGFETVAPGSYTYVIESADGRFARADLVVPDDRSQVLLPKLSLPPLATLSVQVDPPFAGAGEGWVVQLVPRASNPHRTEAVSLPTDPSGWRELPPVEVGEYLLLVEGAAGSLWHTEEVALREDTTLWLELPSVVVEGRASRGDEPFVGELIFGGPYGSRTFTLTTDEEGRFTGVLPEEGEWDVEIRSTESGCAPCDGTPGSLRIPPVEVVEGASGKAWIDIEIADTKIEGRVVVAETSPTGEVVHRPQPGASIFVTRISGSEEDRGRQAQIWTADGEFELVGLPPGDLMIGAMHGELGYESEWIPLRLEDRGEAGPIELVLEAKATVSVRVRSRTGPVGGASVSAFVPAGKSARGIAGADGVATLDLARGSTGTLLVSAPGYSLALVPFGPIGQSGSPDREVVLTTPGGDLVLSQAPYDIFSEGSLVSESGGTMPVRVIAGMHPPALSFGESLTLRQLSAGSYAFCTERGDCWRSEVHAGTTTTLDLSEEPR